MTKSVMIQQPRLQGHYAGFMSRLLAFMLDVVTLVLSIMVAVTFFTVLANALKAKQFLSNLVGFDLWQMLTAAFITLFVLGYFIFFWMLTGQTPGKVVMGLRLISMDGNHVSFWQAIRRIFGFLIAAMPFYLGLAWILVDDRRRGWHDKIAGTCVIYDWDARPDETFLRGL